MSGNCWRRKKTTFQLYSIKSSQTTCGTVQVYTGSFSLPLNMNGLKSQFSTNREAKCFYYITFVCLCLCNFCILKLLFLIIFPDLSSPVLLMNKSFWTKTFIVLTFGYLHGNQELSWDLRRRHQDFLDANYLWSGRTVAPTGVTPRRRIEITCRISGEAGINIIDRSEVLEVEVDKVKCFIILIFK